MQSYLYPANSNASITLLALIVGMVKVFVNLCQSVVSVAESLDVEKAVELVPLNFEFLALITTLIASVPESTLP
jgi:hypothetical protein